MAEPTLTDQQRRLLRTFRAIVTERQEAEARAAARFQAEQQAAGAAFDQASQAAEARLSAVHQAQGEAQALLARADLQSLGSQVNVQLPSAGPGDDPAQKLALHAARAKEVAASLPTLVEALQSTRKHARRRQLVLAAVGVVGLIVVVNLIAGALRDLQEQRALRQAQATATAETMAAQATATAETMAAQDTATAEAMAAQTTATAETMAAQDTATAEAMAAQATATAMSPLLARLEQQTGMQMVYVPPGEFIMGSPEGQGSSNEHPQHTVYLSAYWIDQTEVTVAQYRLCVESGACSVLASWGTCTFGDADRTDHPVNCLDWSQAESYCAWADKRLPTEAEWEKAARGTDSRLWPWGNRVPDAKLANFGRNVGSTTPVGSYSSYGASPYGALDMAGNVSEWVADWYSNRYSTQLPRENPRGPASGQYRVIRGGAWYNSPALITAANRTPGRPSTYDGTLGFRCARSP